MTTQENVIKTCKINDEVFKELVEGVKHCVDKSDSRPVLRYIQVAVKEKSVVFTALDGFRAGRTEHEQDNADCFTCYIQPFPYKPLGGMPSDVVIEYDGKTAWVEFLTVFGKLRYAFKQPDANFPDMEKIYADNRKAQDRTNYGNGYYIAQACKALGRLDGRQHVTAIKTSEEKTIAFILSAKSNAITNEQLILPIRVTREDD